MGTTYFKQKRQINKPIFEGNTDFLIPTVDKYPAQVIEGKNPPYLMLTNTRSLSHSRFRGGANQT